MQLNVELDDVLVKKAMDLTNISTETALINRAIDDLIKSNTRKEMLKYADSGIWEGNLTEMRAMR
jgi:Arc/MetJ family transcription regulator